MEFNELIRTRESIRNYDRDRPVPNDILENILEAGRLAPSACNNQPWKFLLVSSPDMLRKIGNCYDREWFKKAPHILIIVGFKDQAWVRKSDGYNSIETDLAIAMTHIILSAENEGVGACWIENYNPSHLKEVLHITESQVIFGITPLGYTCSGFTKAGNKKRKCLNDIVEYL